MQEAIGKRNSQLKNKSLKKPVYRLKGKNQNSSESNDKHNE